MAFFDKSKNRCHGQLILGEKIDILGFWGQNRTISKTKDTYFVKKKSMLHHWELFGYIVLQNCAM